VFHDCMTSSSHGSFQTSSARLPLSEPDVPHVRVDTSVMPTVANVGVSHFIYADEYTIDGASALTAATFPVPPAPNVHLLESCAKFEPTKRSTPPPPISNPYGNTCASFTGSCNANVTRSLVKSNPFMDTSM